LNDINRRTFLQLSAGAGLASAAVKVTALSAAPSLTEESGVLRVQGLNYLWQYAQADDRFTLFDTHHRIIVAGIHQPAIVVAPAGNPTQRICTPGKPTKPAVANHSSDSTGEIRITISYQGVNGDARISLTWRFNQHGIWTDPVVYESNAAQNVVSLHFFSANDGTIRTPSLHPTYLVVPGVISGSTVSPNTPASARAVMAARGNVPVASTSLALGLTTSSMTRNSASW